MISGLEGSVKSLRPQLGRGCTSDKIILLYDGNQFLTVGAALSLPYENVRYSHHPPHVCSAFVAGG